MCACTRNDSCTGTFLSLPLLLGNSELGFESIAVLFLPCNLEVQPLTPFPSHMATF